MTAPLHAYQCRALAWMDEHNTGYLAVDMGLGKTRIVLEFIKTHDIRPVLVVAPLRVATSTWPQEIAKWAPELKFQVLHGKEKSTNFRKPADIYIINYDGLKWLDNTMKQYVRSKFMHSMLVLDEATMVKSKSSKRFKYIKDWRAAFDRAYALSATPAPNGYQDLWAQYFLLDYGKTLGTSFASFFNKYFRMFGTYQVAPISKAHVNDIFKRCCASTFRLDAQDYLKLPGIVHNDVHVALTPSLRKKYEILKREFVLRLEEEKVITAANTAILSMKLRQFCQGHIYCEDVCEHVHDIKLDALEQLIYELQGEPVLIAVQFRFEIAALQKRFPDTPAIYGGTSANEADELIARWNSGKIPVLICHPASISHGVNLQHGGHNIIWFALTWNLEQYMQFNGRLARQGQTKPVVVSRILLEKTVEERIAKVLEQKGTSQQALLDAIRALARPK